MRTTRAVVILIVLQGLILAGQWLGSAPVLVTPAQAQPFEPTRDRKEIIEELRTLNGKMDRLMAILEKGELQVRPVLPDERNERAPAR
jgi:cAMP phosphodiesterase